MSEEQTTELNENTASVSTEAGEQAAEEFSLEDLFNEGIEEDNVKEAEKAMLLPVGTYTTETPLMVKTGKDKIGRPFARYFSTVVLGDRRGKIGFGLSWVHKFAKDKEGNQLETPDRSYKNYVMSIKAFRVAYSREPANVGEVLAYLRDYAVRLRIIQTSDGENMVVSISAVRG